MSDKVTIQTVDSLQNQVSALTKINANFEALADKIDTLLSRDGDTPNQMESNLDMNSYRVTNLPEPIDNTEPIRKIDFEEAVFESIGIISNTNLANMPESRIKMRAAGTGNGPPIDGTPAQARTAMSVMSATETTDYMKRYGVTPFDFGALGQGADETSQLNAAIDAVITGGGGTVWLPAPPSGAWRFNSRIQMFKSGDQTSYVKVTGVGDKARIEIAATSGDIFDFGSTSATYYAALENLHVVNLNVRTSGIALRFRNNSKAKVKSCVFDGLYSGIDTNTVNDLLFEDVDLNFPNQTNGRAINHQASVSPSATRSDVMVYKNVNVQCNNGGTDGMFIEGPVYGVTTDGLYMLGANNGLYISSPSSNPNEFPQYCRFSVFETDRAKDRSLYMLKARYFDFERCLFSNTSGATGDLYPQGNADNEAVRIESNVQDVNFDQTRIGFCRKQAAVIGGQRIRMLGCTFEDAAKDTPTDYALVYLPATARVVHLRDCFGDGANRARFAVQYESAVTGKCVDFAWTGMKSGGAFSAGSATSFVPAGQYQY
jgi:hypothetical protein